MPKATRWDFLGAGILWTAASFLVGMVIDASGAPGEIVVIMGLGTWSVGLAAARVWWLRRGGSDDDTSPRVGLSTGEMAAQRLADMEARVYELEERLELTERLLAQTRERPRIPLVREDTPV